MSENLLPLDAVMARVGVRSSKIYAMIQRGEFPAPVKIGFASRWPSSAVDAWIAARIAEQQPAACPSGDAAPSA